MAISTREILLILRARDEASRVLRTAASSITGVSNASAQAAQKQIQQGAAMTTVGVAAAYAGLEAIKFLDNATDAAMEYENQARKTLTQVDQVGASLKTIKDIGKDVASNVPTDFKKIQESLYDIFSSMDVSVPESKKLLTEFSKAGVAGQVDLQDASRATIGIMNAYGLTTKDVTKVNDVMFQLVRKGVGTYGEFASTIGRAVPSAVRSGQSIEVLAGMMAFLTRNGLSAAMASASAGRALDAISNPKTVDHFDALGKTVEKALGKDRAIALFGKNYKSMSIDIRDAHGNIKPMPQIMTELGSAIGKLPSADRAAVLQELFKSSGGTIQARRFFDIAVTQFGEFNQRVQEMYNSKGAMEEAYKIMFDSPQAKMQLLENRWNILKTVIGDALLPIKMGTVETFSTIIGWFSKLDPELQKNIAVWASVAAGILILVGVIIGIAGLVLMFNGALVLAGTSLVGLMGPVLLVVGIIAALAAIIYLAWQNHDKLLAIAKQVWEYIKPAVQAVGDAFKDLWDKISQLVLPIFKAVWDDIQKYIGPAVDKFKEAWAILVQGAKDTWQEMQRLDGFIRWLGRTLWDILKVAIEVVVAVFMTFVDVLGHVVGPAIDMIAGVFKGLANMLAGFFKFVFALITGDWANAWDAALQLVKGFGQVLIALFTGIFGPDGIIVGIIKGLWDAVVRVFKWAFDVLVGHSIVPDMLNAIVRYFTEMPGRILGVLTSFASNLYSWASNAITNAYNAFVNGGNNVIRFFADLPGRVFNFVNGMYQGMYSAGWNAMVGLYNGLVGMGQRAVDYVRGLVQSIRNMWPFSPAKEGPLKNHPMDRAGANLMTMLADGINSRKALVLNSMKSIAGEVSVSASTMSAPVVPFYGRGPGGDGMGGAGVTQNFYIQTQEIDPTKHAADLGFELERRRG